MIVLRLLKRSILGIGAASLLVAVAGASPALAASPWWSLVSGARPASIQPGVARSEVQEVTVSATGGNFYLIAAVTERGAVVPVGASAGDVQGLLETEVYGAGNVQVAAKTGLEPDSTTYTITFVGELADQPVKPLTALADRLVGGNAKVSASEVTVGRPDGEVVLTAENLGDATAEGASIPARIADKLPPGLKAVSIVGTTVLEGSFNELRPLSCSLGSLTCTWEGAVPPYDQLEARIGVVVQPGAQSGEVNRASVSGGGASSESTERPVALGSGPVRFGVEDYGFALEEEGGAPDTQAGSHPFQYTTTLAFNQGADANPAPLPEEQENNLGPAVSAVGLLKDVKVKLPPGFIGNPTALPHCTLAQFYAWNGLENQCPANTAVGVASLSLYDHVNFTSAFTLSQPIFNIEPAVGEPARFGFFVSGASVPVLIDTAVRTGTDYGVTASVSEISENASLYLNKLTFWGVPGDPSHDSVRGWSCLDDTLGDTQNGPCTAQDEPHPSPFLALPTSCTGPLQTSVQADSWEEPGNEVSPEPDPSEPVQALDGCNHLPFAPSIEVSPDVQAGSTATGLKVDVHVPQEESLNPEGLANADIKDIKVTLPEGVTLNPSGANGLEACSEGQVGFTGIEEPSHTDLFTPTMGSPFCPDAAKVGTVKITTPLLPNPLEGAVYLASQNANPFGSLVAMYIIAEDPTAGTLVKLPGEVALNSQTGQIESTFENTPQLPFEDAELHFFGGERAPLSTPSHCGTYTTRASFTPWSGEPPVSSTTSFAITSGPNGSACPGASLPFSPSLTSGTTNNNAGAFSPLTTTIGREDGQQNIQNVTLHYPPGVSGILTGIPLCGEAEANAGTCSSASEIGETVVSVGLGGDPYTVTGGKVYLTAPYQGAPFGLSIVNPAVAGPFNLGQVIVRAKIEINPLTAALTVTTGTIPHILDGIPLQIKHINVTINRQGFTFNPTNCNPQTLTGSIGSVEGASSLVSTPFQPANCASLKFEPKVSVSTQAHTSKADGASLTYRIAYPNVPQGTDADIHYVKVELPGELPSRLTTLQKACAQKQFQTNPAGCPKESVIGHAKAIVPNIPVPLEGPVYFVSNGGEAFPNLTMVLQGYGVTIDLVGDTLIKNGVTSTTFNTVPDNPVTSFEINLPEGKFSALAANGNLCKPTKTETVKKKVKVKVKGHEKTLTRKVKEQVATSLTIPSDYIGQNGAAYNTNAPVTVTGCPKAKVAKKAKVKKKAKGKKKK